MKTIAKLFTPILLIGIISSCIDEKTPIAKEEKTLVKTVMVTEETVIEPVHSVGKVFSKAEAKLGFKTGGIIKNIFVDEGQVVHKGQVLAILNLGEIDARLNQAKLGYEKAKRDYKRATNLYKDSVVTLEQLENVLTQLDYAKSSLKIASFNHKYSKIIAPENGKILKRLAEPNELINSGYPVFVFGSSANDWVVRANIPECEIFRISENDKAKVSLDAYPDRIISAEITEIGNSADPYTGTYEIELTIKDRNIKLASGLFARFDIFPANSKVFDVIPVNALVEANEKEGFVYKVLNTDQIVREKVYIHNIQNQSIYVQSELVKGDLIVTEGSSYINSNSKIEIAAEPNELAAK